MALQEHELEGGEVGDGAARWTAARTAGPGSGRWKRIELTGERRLVSATVDPEDRLVDRRQPAQQLPARRAGRPRRRALGRALGLLAAAAARHGGALGHDRHGHARRPRRRPPDARGSPSPSGSSTWRWPSRPACRAGSRSARPSASCPRPTRSRDGFDLGVLIDLVELRPGLLGGLAFSALGVAVPRPPAGRGGDGRRARGADEPRRPALRPPVRPRRRPLLRALRARGPSRGRRRGRASAGLVAGPLLALSGRLRRESGSELATNATLAGGGRCSAASCVLLALLALDAARVRIVREDARRVLPAPALRASPSCSATP